MPPPTRAAALWASWIEVADLETDRLLAAERGWLARHRWSVLAGVAGLTLLLLEPAWMPQIVGWTLLGLGFLPPVASWVRERAEA